MLNNKKLETIKEFLEKSQNPLFFFDNDVDGLCSFLILQRAIGRGKGVAVRSFPELDKSYLRKVNEFSPDAIFILDKPRVESDFIEGVHEKGIPIIWVDHHDVQVDSSILESVEYFNSSPESEPVTYICYKIFNRKEDMWLGMIGCIGDVFMPDFAQDFSTSFPELFNPNLSAFDALYLTEIGRAVKMLNFGLKDSTTNVVNLMKFLIKAGGVYDILEENPSTRHMHLRYKQLEKVYKRLLEKAELNASYSKLLVFSYGGEMSISSEIANGLYFKHKNKLIVVIYKKQDRANVSIRGKNARKIVDKLVEIEGVSGGGHEQACGVQVPIEKLEEFNEKLRELVR